jgi:hypothetical protein
MGCGGCLTSAFAWLGVLTFVLGLAATGAIGPEQAAMILVGLAALAGIARGHGSGVATAALRFGVPIADSSCWRGTREGTLRNRTLRNCSWHWHHLLLSSAASTSCSGECSGTEVMVWTRR